MVLHFSRIVLGCAQAERPLGQHVLYALTKVSSDGKNLYKNKENTLVSKFLSNAKDLSKVSEVV